MGDLGLQGAFGQSALRAAIVQRLQMQRDAQQQALQNDLAMRGSDRADRQLEETSALRRATEAQNEQNHLFTQAHQLASDLSPNQTVSAPTVGILKRAGRGDLVKENPEPAGAPFLEGGSDFVPGEQPGAVFTGTAEQRDKLADNDRQQRTADEAARYRAGEPDRKFDEFKRQHDYETAHPKPSTAQDHFQLQPEIDPKTGAQTGRFLGYNTKTNSFSPIGGETPQATKAGPGAAQNAQHEQAKKDALGSLDQLDKALDDAKDLVGPMAGRYSSIQQMAGSADPKIQALGTKLLLAKMQVDHAATGTVRAGASPQLLARWDNLLANKTSHEGLKASVQAMREILSSGAAGGEGAKVPMVAPDGRHLNVPAEKVAEMEKLGAKRAGAK